MGPAKPPALPTATPTANPSAPPRPAPPSPEHARLAAEQAALKRELSRVYAEACGCKRRGER